MSRKISRETKKNPFYKKRQSKSSIQYVIKLIFKAHDSSSQEGNSLHISPVFSNELFIHYLYR